MQANQDKVALLTSKLPEIMQNITAVRETIKQVYPDSWLKWATKWMSASTPPAVPTDEDVFTHVAATLGGLNVFIDEFNGNLATIKAQAADNAALLEKLSAIENSLKGIAAASKEIITTLTPQATLGSIFSRLLGSLWGTSNQ